MESKNVEQCECCKKEGKTYLCETCGQRTCGKCAKSVTVGKAFCVECYDFTVKIIEDDDWPEQ